MIDDREIWACANALLRRHGDEARAVATRRADELLAKGDVEGHHTFLRILERIKALETTSPADTVH